VNGVVDDEAVKTRRHESGFTLIEVLVASAIIMASIGVLMQLFASGLDRTQRAGRVAHMLVAQRAIVHQLAMVNPADQKGGEGVAEGIHYRWEAKTLAPLVPMYDSDHKPWRQFGLFSLHVIMEYGSGKQRDFNMKLIGWQEMP